MARLVLGGYMPVLGGVRKRTVRGSLKRHSRTKQSSSSSSSPSKKQGGSWFSWGRSTRRSTQRSTQRKGRKGCSKKRRRMR